MTPLPHYCLPLGCTRPGPDYDAALIHKLNQIRLPTFKNVRPVNPKEPNGPTFAQLHQDAFGVKSPLTGFEPPQNDNDSNVNNDADNNDNDNDNNNDNNNDNSNDDVDKPTDLTDKLREWVHDFLYLRYLDMNHIYEPPSKKFEVTAMDYLATAGLIDIERECEFPLGRAMLAASLHVRERRQRGETDAAGHVYPPLRKWTIRQWSGIRPTPYQLARYILERENERFAYKTKAVYPYVVPLDTRIVVKDKKAFDKSWERDAELARAVGVVAVDATFSPPNVAVTKRLLERCGRDGMFVPPPEEPLKYKRLDLYRPPEPLGGFEREGEICYLKDEKHLISVVNEDEIVGPKEKVVKVADVLDLEKNGAIKRHLDDDDKTDDGMLKEKPIPREDYLFARTMDMIRDARRRVFEERYEQIIKKDGYMENPYYNPRRLVPRKRPRDEFCKVRWEEIRVRPIGFEFGF